MLKHVRHFFSPPIFEDSEKTRLARILHIFGLISSFLVFLLIVNRLLTGAWGSDSSYYTLPSLLLVLICVVILSRWGYVRFAGRFAVGLIWGLMTYQAYHADGLWDAALLTYFSMVILAAFLLGWREGMIVGICSIGVFWHLAYQQLHSLRAFHVDTPYHYARDLTVIFIITCVLIYYLVYSMNRSLVNARIELKERLRAEAKLQTQANYLTALHETTLGLVNRLELIPLFELILYRIRDLFDTEHVAIDIVSADDLILKQELGLGYFAQNNGITTKKGEGIIGKVWESGTTIFIQDYAQWEGRYSKAEKMSFKTALSVPLKSGTKVIGTLTVAQTENKHAFSAEQVILFERFAALASIAIDNARLYQEAQAEILERKIIETELRASDERFRKVFNNNKVAIAIGTLDEGIFLEANEAFWQFSGLSPDKALRHSVLEFNLWHQSQDYSKIVHALKEYGSIHNVEVNFAEKSALAYYELITLREQACVLSMFYDITEIKQIQKALKDAETRNRAILESIPDMIFEMSKEGIFLDYVDSPEITPIAPPSEFIGKHINLFLPPQVVEQTLFAIERAIATKQLHAFEYQLPNYNKLVTYEARITGITDNTAILMIRDISQRKWVENEREKLISELEEKNAEAETLRESVAIVVETLDKSEAIDRILEQLEKVIPFNSASVQLLHEGVLEIVSTRGLEPKSEHIGTRFEVTEEEPAYVLLQGDEPYVLIDDVQLSTPTFLEEKHSKIHGWMAIPLRVKGQLIGIIALDGHEVAQFNKRDAELAVTYANQVAIAIENARLFSELQGELIERKKLIDELEIKNSELERFAYTVSHDLKSPLITIKGFLGFLEQDALHGNIPRLRGDIQRISDATNKMQTLLNELLNLSRVGRLVNESQQISFNELVNEALELVHGRLQANHIQVQVQDNLPNIYGDRPRLLEVLQNLIDNAAKFVRFSPQPLIQIGCSGYESGKPIFFVQDNGVGIDEAHHERIFGLFNKLDADSEGTGIGLALVKRIIEIHGGRIWVKSEVGQGAIFYFTLPVESGS